MPLPAKAALAPARPVLQAGPTDVDWVALGTVDPLTGVVHRIGAEVLICEFCRAAYAPDSLASVRAHGDQCMTCSRSFRAGLPARAVVAGGTRHAGRIKLTPTAGARIPARRTTPAERANAFYQPQMKVIHDSMGLGVVESIEYRQGMVDLVTVRFEKDPSTLVQLIGNYPNMDCREWD